MVGREWLNVVVVEEAACSQINGMADFIKSSQRGWIGDVDEAMHHYMQCDIGRQLFDACWCPPPC